MPCATAGCGPERRGAGFARKLAKTRREPRSIAIFRDSPYSPAMTSRAVRLSQWIERLRREHSQAERSWLRQGRLDQAWVSGVRQLLSDEGAELFEDAQRERVWSADELRAAGEQRAWLAFEAELAKAAPLATELALEP